MRDFAHSDDPAVQRQLDRLAALSVPNGRLGLETIRALLGKLGDPQKRLPPVFHVAGTNGKGSVCAFLRAMLEAQGLAVHMTISPHLVRYNERIRIAGALISDQALAALLEEVLDAGEALAPSFFEVTIAAAFLAFSREPSDACVVEVGLGGRFDATNVLEPDVLAACGIAALGLDHERFLLAPEDGVPTEAMARIAFEKAGIAKPGVALLAQAYSPGATHEIIKAARRVGAPLGLRGDAWTVSAEAMLQYRDASGAITLPLPALPGAHQVENAGLALAMIQHQQKLAISPMAMSRGLREASWPARLQWLSPGPVTELVPERRVLLDGGHNPDAARALSAYLEQGPKPVDAIIGMLAAKDTRGFLEPLAPHFASLTVVPVEGHEHASPVELAALAKSLGVPQTHTAADIHTALQLLTGRERPGEPAGGTVFIGGSLYLAGEVLRANREFPA